MPSAGSRLTVEQRIKKRNAGNVREGRPAGWADEALDYYLSGEPPGEIARAFECNLSTLYRCIANAALYRMMRERGVDELKDLVDG